jgi:hypothetical protein
MGKGAGCSGTRQAGGRERRRPPPHLLGVRLQQQDELALLLLAQRHGSHHRPPVGRVTPLDCVEAVGVKLDSGASLGVGLGWRGLGWWPAVQSRQGSSQHPAQHGRAAQRCCCLLPAACLGAASGARNSTASRDDAAGGSPGLAGSSLACISSAYTGGFTTWR